MNRQLYPLSILEQFVKMTQHNSDYDDSSADELFREHDTVDTIPVSAGPAAAGRSTPPPFTTQPTQILNTPTQNKANKTGDSVVQVAASSPAASLHGRSPMRSPMPLRIGNLMAPPGTRFRPPPPLPAPRRTADLSDGEEVVTIVSSSDEEGGERRSSANIKPSTFKSGGGAATTRVEESPVKPAQDLRTHVVRFAYDPLDTASRKRPAVDDMVGAYARSRKRQNMAQSGPARALPVVDVDSDADDLASSPKQQQQPGIPTRIADLPDFGIRRMVERLRAVWMHTPERLLIAAYYKCKFNYNDALDYLAEHASNDFGPEESQLSSPQLTAPKPAVKRQVQKPLQSIRDRWAPSQAKPVLIPDDSPPKPKRRLVRGRKNPSSPVALQETPPRPAGRSQEKQKAIVIEDDDEFDSSAREEEVEEEQERELERQVLDFFNTGTVKDLADIAEQPHDVASFIMSKRPFRRLDRVRELAMEAPGAGAAPSTKKMAKKARPIGDKIVDVCLAMWQGYEAVDQLVAKCEALGKPLTAEMKSWGLIVKSKSGELAAMSLEETAKQRDSGVGSPSSPNDTAAEEEEEKEEEAVARGVRTRQFLKKPAIMSKELELKDYQEVGLNWLDLLWRRKLSGILADDMGLGKTCQVITFLSHLKETGQAGPHLVVVLPSTLENWLREFQTFSPGLVVEPYYGSQAERAEQREQIEVARDAVDVVVTTYSVASSKTKADLAFLRKVVRPRACVFDEGHALRNHSSKKYADLMRIPAEFRLLLTGTPLQNNLQELVSLLAFIMPQLFRAQYDELRQIFKHKAKTSDADHAALLSAQRIARARSMMTPFVLRRKKHQVLKHLPPKTCRVEYCDMTASQREIYEAHLAAQQRLLAERAAGTKPTATTTAESTNVLMRLRKAAIHPLLTRRRYTDATIARMAREYARDPTCSAEQDLVLADLAAKNDFQVHAACGQYATTLGKFALPGEPWMDSGKVQKLAELLRGYVANGDRALVFSQFTSVMDVLESVLATLGIAFFRLDGSTPVPERQAMLDEFAADAGVPVFMLSTRSGGVGVNLACANKVVVFDQSFNPQDDVQAENRAHRVGQTRPVEVVRLVTRGTVEEQILALGESKMALDERVAGAAAAAAAAAAAEEEDEGAGRAVGKGKKARPRQAEGTDTPAEVEALSGADREGLAAVEEMLRGELGGGGGAAGAKKRDPVKDSFLAGLRRAGLDVSAA